MARRLAYDLSTDKLAVDALLEGLESFQKTMLSQPYDQAIYLIVALRKAGLKIVKAPRPRKEVN